MTIDYIGSGLTFPLGADLQGRLATTNGESRIEQSIRIILSTALGERTMRPEFGCAIWDHVFAAVTPATLIQMADATREALRRWEPRIELLDVVVHPDGGDRSRLLIHIDYAVAATNDRRNLVYPFYTIPPGADR